MSVLYLMRHGHAPPPGECGAPTDAARPLSPRGREEARRAAAGLRARGARPALVLHSPLRRAVETAEEAAAALGVPARVYPLLDNTRPPGAVLPALLREAREAGELLAVGHMPQMAELCEAVAGSAPAFPTAGVAALELSEPPRLLWALQAA